MFEFNKSSIPTVHALEYFKRVGYFLFIRHTLIIESFLGALMDI